MHTVPVALAGYGLAGKVFHAPLITSVEGLRLSEVVSSNPAKVGQDLPGVTVVPTIDRALANPDTEVVVIATPNTTHFDFARRALEAGKHVVVDKPFTVTVAEAETLVELASREGRILAVFQSRRWDADFLTLRRILASGELGDIVHVESRYDRYRPVVQARWKEQDGPGSGIWYDLGAHLADQALQLFGPPEAVFADLTMQRQGARAVDYFHVQLRYPRLRVILHGANLVAEPTRRFEVHGTRGSYVKAGMDVQEDQVRRGMRPGDAGWGVDPNVGTIFSWVNGQLRTNAAPNEVGCYQDFYRGLRDAVANGGANPVPAEDGLTVMRLIDAGCRSSAERREAAFA